MDGGDIRGFADALGQVHGSDDYPRESKFSRVLNGSWSKMPEEIRQWRCTVSREQVELYDMEHPELPESA